VRLDPTSLPLEENRIDHKFDLGVISNIFSGDRSSFRVKNKMMEVVGL